MRLLARISVGLAVFVATTAHADRHKPNTAIVEEHRGPAKHVVSGAFGLFVPGWATYTGKENNADAYYAPKSSGFFGLGGDYDYMLRENLSVGGLFRYYATSDSVGSAEERHSLFTLGGMAHAYFYNDPWVLLLGTGFGYVSPNYKIVTNGTASELTVDSGFGFYLQIGVLYQITERFALGVENLRIKTIGEKLNGTPLDDYMIKGRYSL